MFNKYAIITLVFVLIFSGCSTKSLENEENMEKEVVSYSAIEEYPISYNVYRVLDNDYKIVNIDDSEDVIYAENERSVVSLPITYRTVGMVDANYETVYNIGDILYCEDDFDYGMLLQKSSSDVTILNKNLDEIKLGTNLEFRGFDGGLFIFKAESDIGLCYEFYKPSGEKMFDDLVIESVSFSTKKELWK